MGVTLLSCIKEKNVRVLYIMWNFSGSNTDGCFELILGSLGENLIAADLG